jgi:hypothetical protein
LARASWEGLQTYERTKLVFLTELEVQFYPIVPNIERQGSFKFKLNNYWMNLHKIKSGDLIRRLIGQYDLIMGPIKCLIKFKN